MAVLSVRDLTKRYGARTVVDTLAFDVPEGTVFGLLGPNGAGKTTTIRLALGLVRPAAGTVEILGRRLGSRDYHRSLHQVGSLIEGPALYKALSGKRNLEVHARYLGLDGADRRIAEVLDLVGLTGREREKVKRYSLGMRQRLGLALALLPNPRLLILDEPTNGLDPAGIVEFRELIRRFPETGITVMLSSHLLGEVQQACDHVGIINYGRMVMAGPTAEVVASAAAGAGRSYLVEVDPADLPRALEVLTPLGTPAAAVDFRTVHVATGGLDGRALAWHLSGAGIYPEQIRRHEETLEDVFLRLTATPPPPGPGSIGGA
ncbi:MAG: ABC transporter ATP-binding protein [Acidimicrobiia bacterium]|nr:ABC transporter ATP-binding protein [Acidimicrobiia bacterium]